MPGLVVIVTDQDVHGVRVAPSVQPGEPRGELGTAAGVGEVDQPHTPARLRVPAEEALRRGAVPDVDRLPQTCRQVDRAADGCGCADGNGHAGPVAYGLREARVGQLLQQVQQIAVARRSDGLPRQWEELLQAARRPDQSQIMPAEGVGRHEPQGVAAGERGQGQVPDRAPGGKLQRAGRHVARTHRNEVRIGRRAGGVGGLSARGAPGPAARREAEMSVQVRAVADPRVQAAIHHLRTLWLGRRRRRFGQRFSLTASTTAQHQDGQGQAGQRERQPVPAVAGGRRKRRAKASGAQYKAHPTDLLDGAEDAVQGTCQARPVAARSPIG
jgi:hypothetical protein